MGTTSYNSSRYPPGSIGEFEVCHPGKAPWRVCVLYRIDWTDGGKRYSGNSEVISQTLNVACFSRPEMHRGDLSWQLRGDEDCGVLMWDCGKVVIRACYKGTGGRKVGPSVAGYERVTNERTGELGAAIINCRCINRVGVASAPWSIAQKTQA
jgi:hypothetical protein